MGTATTTGPVYVRVAVTGRAEALEGRISFLSPPPAYTPPALSHVLVTDRMTAGQTAFSENRYSRP
jgi:hypothetical protein